MKKNYSLCLLGMMLLANATFAQQTYVKSFDFGGDDYVNALTPALPDGSRYAIGSSSAASAGSYDMALIKIDSTGTPQWEKQFGGTGFDAGRNLLLTSDQAVILTGSTNSFPGTNGSDVLAVKVDPTGNVIWAKSFGTAADDVCYKVTEAPDSGYFFIGQTKGATKDGGKGEILIIKTDRAGTPEWTKTVGSVNGTEFGYEGWAIGQDGLVVGGYSNLGLIGGTDVEMHLVSLTGDLIMSIVFGGTSDDDARKFAPTQNGIMIAGNTRSFGAPNQGDMFVARLEGNSGPPTITSFSLIGNSVDESLTAFNFDGNSGYVGSALYDGNSGIMFGTDTLGKVKWSKQYHGTQSDVIMEANANQRGVFGVGYSNSFGGTANNMFVVNASADGTVPCNMTALTLKDSAVTPTVLGPMIADYTSDTLNMTTTDITASIIKTSNTIVPNVLCASSVGIGAIANNIAFNAYPNPANNSITVSCDEMTGKEATINMVDITGRIVKTITNNQLSEVKINVADLQNGFYTVVLKLAEKQVSHSVVIA